MFSSLATAGLAALSLASGAAAAVDPIVAKGQYFFHSSNGTQFFIRGVAYQQGVGVGGTAPAGQTSFTDPLADAKSCQRDIPLLKELGTNTIRVYAVDPSKDHSQCMKALEDAGIYVIADLSEPDISINRDDPHWNTELMARYTAVIDSMGKFTNTLGFFAGNEVTNNNTNTAASAFVKAAVRDSKAYIASKDFGRWIGVGYATNDDTKTRDELASYFNCADPKEAVDFWGYNIYEWCGQSTFEESGYEERTKAFADYSVPAFFSEYGCNNPGGGAARPWQEVSALYSKQMNRVWSGGLAYEYFQEQNDFGLVSVGKDGEAVKSKDFKALAAQVAKFGYPSPNATVSMGVYRPKNKARACPAVAKGRWEAAEALPPTPDAATCDCMMSAAQCVPAPDLKAKDMGALFGTVCGLDPKACEAIAADGARGAYGAFSMCNSTAQLAHVLNAYYANHGAAAAACDFRGQAKLLASKPTPAAACGPLLSQAEAKPVSGNPTAPLPEASGGASSGGSGSGSGSSSGGSGSSSGGSGSSSGGSGSSTGGSGSSTGSSGSSTGGSGSSTGGSGSSSDGAGSTSGGSGSSTGGTGSDASSGTGTSSGGSSSGGSQGTGTAVGATDGSATTSTPAQAGAARGVVVAGYAAVLGSIALAFSLA